MHNIFVRGSTYYFRKVVPVDVYDTFRKREITFSLQTKSKRLARSKAAVALGAVDTAIYEMRELTDLAKRRTVHKELVTYLDDFRATGNAKLKRVIVSTPSNTTADQKEKEEQSPTLKEAHALYLDEKIKMDWHERTKADGVQAFNCLIDIVGNIRLNKLSKGLAIEVTQQIYDYPAKRNQWKNRNLSLEELKKLGVPTIAPTTAVKHFMHLTTFFNWLVNREYMAANPFSGLKPRAKKAAARTKEPFTANDLNTLFTKRIIKGEDPDKPWRFWVPVLALYTGARLEEISQLDVDDIKQSEGIYYLDIHDRGSHQLKNKSSIRKTPLHKDLLEIGLLEYINSRKDEVKLFNLSLLQGIYGKTVSAWFTFIKNKLNFPSTKVFHSFRHTFRDFAVESRVPSEHIKALLGHTQGDMTHGVYGSGFSLSLLNESMQQIDFSCVRDILIKEA
ncbi:site-specific integrase [Endozoicomonas sp. SM1973]|uniref:Site-specific integrase n=1 Tax=Spartinivicinus marinus TaxID=2994442 RepID=A0A853HV91_9GAMM|nr:site-specific integrase [Spartinivicinus marinus]MCX4025608.1 site-specific integrase [Spartinivicinus marinus]NYZ65163.1 site-specific integrase [Spartinivicinus marinus]